MLVHFCTLITFDTLHRFQYNLARNKALSTSSAVNTTGGHSIILYLVLTASVRKRQEIFRLTNSTLNVCDSIEFCKVRDFIQICTVHDFIQFWAVHSHHSYCFHYLKIR